MGGAGFFFSVSAELNDVLILPRFSVDSVFRLLRAAYQLNMLTTMITPQPIQKICLDTARSMVLTWSMTISLQVEW